MSDPNDWRTYATLSPDFTTQERERVEAALDFIAQSSDGEGIGLLKAGMVNNRGESLIIAPAVDGGSSFGAAYNGVVGIDFEEARRATIADDGNGNDRPLSLTGILTHELYHLAQRPNNYENVHARVDQKIDKANIKESIWQEGNPNADLDAMARSQAHALIGAEINQLTAERLRPGETQQSILPVIPETRILDVVARSFRNNLESIVDTTKSIDGSGSPLIEQEATNFTDAFLAKNALDAEQRVHYDNGKVEWNERVDVTLLAPTGREFHSLGYQGTTADPVVTPTDGVNTNPYATLLQDFKGADGICGDNQHYCISETGQLSGVAMPNNAPSKDSALGRP